ncbi:MAG TPA: hypothetical protein VFX16_23600 [Pseudonocardiaceae bacterium]|nr:hypothetical protein [Pseudonocardiaceae bacterium]
MDESRAQRARQRGVPGFGAFADREIVYLRRHREDDDPAVYVMEIRSDGQGHRPRHARPHRVVRLLVVEPTGGQLGTLGSVAQRIVEALELPVAAAADWLRSPRARHQFR